MTRLREFASFDRLKIEELVVEGARVKLVSPQTLYCLKRNTVRDKDRMDAASIEEKFGLTDEDVNDHGGA